MIEIVTGNMFDIDADVLINTVNCVGVMGCGVALEFRRRYPKMFSKYRRLCNMNKIMPGTMWVWKTEDEKLVVNFPTKKHWRNSSQYSYVENGLRELRELLSGYNNGSVVAIPALGCGHGGLDWDLVLTMIKKELANLDHLNIHIFQPQDSRSIGG